MISLRPAALFFPICALFLASCSSELSTRPLFVVTAVSARPMDANTPAAGANLTLQVVSENVYSYGFSRSIHKLYLNGTLVGKTENRSPFGIAPMATVTREISVPFDNGAEALAAITASGGPQAAYRLEHVLHITSGESKYEFKTTSKGSLDLSSFIQASR